MRADIVAGAVFPDYELTFSGILVGSLFRSLRANEF